MRREIEIRLLDFCAGQWKRFDQSEWSDFAASFADRAVVALYLSNTSWFGHRRELLEIAERLHPGCVGHISETFLLTDFDPSHFRSLIQARLAHEKGVPWAPPRATDVPDGRGYGV